MHVNITFCKYKTRKKAFGSKNFVYEFYKICIKNFEKKQKDKSMLTISSISAEKNKWYSNYRCKPAKSLQSNLSSISYKKISFKGTSSEGSYMVDKILFKKDPFPDIKITGLDMFDDILSRIQFIIFKAQKHLNNIRDPFCKDINYDFKKAKIRIKSAEHHLNIIEKYLDETAKPIDEELKINIDIQRARIAKLKDEIDAT